MLSFGRPHCQTAFTWLGELICFKVILRNSTWLNPTIIRGGLNRYHKHDILIPASCFTSCVCQTVCLYITGCRSGYLILCALWKSACASSYRRIGARTLRHGSGDKLPVCHRNNAIIHVQPYFRGPGGVSGNSLSLLVVFLNIETHSLFYTTLSVLKWHSWFKNT